MSSPDVGDLVTWTQSNPDVTPPMVLSGIITYVFKTGVAVVAEPRNDYFVPLAALTKAPVA